MEILCPSEGAYPLWPKPGRLSAGYAAAHTDSHAHMCAVFAVHTVLLLCQICQFRAWGIRLLARPLPGQPPLVRIGSPVLGATWHARCAEALAWRSTCVCPLSGPRSWTTAFPHALWHGSVCCIRCTHLPPVLSAARCLRLVSLLVGRPSRGIGGTERSATSPLPTPACSRLRFLVLLQDSPHHEGCILCLPPPCVSTQVDANGISPVTCEHQFVVCRAYGHAASANGHFHSPSRADRHSICDLERRRTA